MKTQSDYNKKIWGYRCPEGMQLPHLTFQGVLNTIKTRNHKNGITITKRLNENENENYSSLEVWPFKLAMRRYKLNKL
jgi:hypothetical protein